MAPGRLPYSFLVAISGRLAPTVADKPAMCTDLQHLDGSLPCAQLASPATQSKENQRPTSKETEWTRCPLVAT